MKSLIVQAHGLGDVVQTSVVLQHLARHRPDWEIDVICGIGKETALRGLCHAVYHDKQIHPVRSDYERVFNLGWTECYNLYADSPCTKACKCLREVFLITPELDLCRYVIHPTEEDFAAADNYLESLGCRREDDRYNAVIIHYQGNTSARKKDLAHTDAAAICELAIANGFVPIILDWDRRSRIPDQKKVFNPGAGHPLWHGYGTGDAGRMAALIERSRLFAGIDSGPGKVAGATSTPTVIAWRQHHPLMFHHLCENTLHLVPVKHREIHPAQHDGPYQFFRDHYEYIEYEDLTATLIQAYAGKLNVTSVPWNPMRRSHMLQARSFHIEYYEEHRQAGLDYLGHGEWQESYGRWLVDALSLKDKDVLDIGCACGSIAFGLQKAGCRPHGIDLNNHMIALGKQRFPVPLYVCDAVNLHLFGDESFDCVHSNQVAEHWKERLVPEILQEVKRVLKPGGVFFTVLDTADLFERQGRQHEKEDPTNGCIRPLAWWLEALRAAGFVDVRVEHESAMTEHPKSFFRRYDWDWWLVRKGTE